MRIRVDEVLRDLKKFCEDHEYPEIGKNIDQAREIYREELNDALSKQRNRRKSDLLPKGNRAEQLRLKVISGGQVD